jgi:rhodanese-related sulfurtransferase
MAAPDTINATQLSRLVGTPEAPVIVDVRIDTDYASDPRMLPASIRRDYRTVSSWAQDYAGQPVVVVCQRGKKLSQGVAAWLRHAGARAENLEGGFEAWLKSGGLLVRPDHVPDRDQQGRTVWVTRARPKIDRIACPWLIRRFNRSVRRVPVRSTTRGRGCGGPLPGHAVRHRGHLLEPSR